MITYHSDGVVVPPIDLELNPSNENPIASGINIYMAKGSLVAPTRSLLWLYTTSSFLFLSPLY